MVLGVCRRFLRHSHDIEDAFQATFLILVRRAKSLRDRELLGHWLYGVAYRVAVRARAKAALRRVREGSAVEEVAIIADPARVSDWHEVNPLLDAEINRLPDRYRAPIVLCLIEDRTHEEAARALGWPVGTVKSRLARGASGCGRDWPGWVWHPQPRSWVSPWLPIRSARRFPRL